MIINKSYVHIKYIKLAHLSGSSGVASKLSFLGDSVGVF